MLCLCVTGIRGRQREGGCGETVMNKMSPMEVTVVFLLSGSKKPQESWMGGNTLVKWSRDWRVCPGLLGIHKRQKSCIVISNYRRACGFVCCFFFSRRFSSEVAHIATQMSILLAFDLKWSLSCHDLFLLILLLQIAWIRCSVSLKRRRRCAFLCDARPTDSYCCSNCFSLSVGH